MPEPSFQLSDENRITNESELDERLDFSVDIEVMCEEWAGVVRAILMRRKQEELNVHVKD